MKGMYEGHGKKRKERAGVWGQGQRGKPYE